MAFLTMNWGISGLRFSGMWLATLGMTDLLEEDIATAARAGRRGETRVARATHPRPALASAPEVTMEMPRPTAEHRKLQLLLGDWEGEERMAPSPWGPG